jgi:hypothetical protein
MTRFYMVFCSSNPIGQEGIASLACLAQLQLLNPTADSASHWKAAIRLWYKYSHYKSFMSGQNYKALCIFVKRILPKTFKCWQRKVQEDEWSKIQKSAKSARLYDYNHRMRPTFVSWQQMIWVKSSQHQPACPICAERHSW